MPRARRRGRRFFQRLSVLALGLHLPRCKTEVEGEDQGLGPKEMDTRKKRSRRQKEKPRDREH